MKVGVLALQGAFAAHMSALEALGVAAFEIRTVEQLANADRLVIPGGESTTISMMLARSEMVEPLREYLGLGRPVFGTCAGAILLAARVEDGRDDQIAFGVLDMDIRRNAFGRQRESFEADLAVDGMDDDEFHAVFIRAPQITRWGASVDVLASLGDSPALVRSGPVLCATFHPELSGDLRIHEMFISMHAASGNETE